MARISMRIRRRELEESYNGIKRRDRAKLFSVAADEWLVLKSLTLAASSQRIERDDLKHLRPHFEKRLVSDIQAKDVSYYQQARLIEKASPKTINLEVGTLRAILRRHRVWAEIQQDVRMLPTLDDVGRAITSEEEVALLSACLKSRCRCLYRVVMLALHTGMRYSEIRLLQAYHHITKGAFKTGRFAAQRNLTLVKSGNPGYPATQTVQHTFIVKPSLATVDQPGGFATEATVGATIATGARQAKRGKRPGEAQTAAAIVTTRSRRPDELIIRWNNVPRPAQAMFYMPEVDADEILKLAALRQHPSTCGLGGSLGIRMRSLRPGERRIQLQGNSPPCP